MSVAFFVSLPSIEKYVSIEKNSNTICIYTAKRQKCIILAPHPHRTRYAHSHTPLIASHPGIPTWREPRAPTGIITTDSRKGANLAPSDNAQRNTPSKKCPLPPTKPGSIQLPHQHPQNHYILQKQQPKMLRKSINSISRITHPHHH
jgi:hypothetical protein